MSPHTQPMFWTYESTLFMSAVCRLPEWCSMREGWFDGLSSCSLYSQVSESLPIIVDFIIASSQLGQRSPAPAGGLKVQMVL